MVIIMTVLWENYVYPLLREATLNDVEKLESIIGVNFPKDYKDLVVQNQGKRPNRETVVSGELSSATFGPLLHVLDDCSQEQSLYSVIKKWKKWRDIYLHIVPIADSAGTGCFFAYDYSNHKENPPVVFVDVETDPDDDDAILFVADSLSDVVSALV